MQSRWTLIVASGPRVRPEWCGVERQCSASAIHSSADKNVKWTPLLFYTLLLSMSLPPAIEVTVPPKRFPSGYVDGVRPSHHMNNTKTKFTNPWQSFRLVAVDVYSSLLNLCRFQTFSQLLSVRDFPRDTYCLIKRLHLGSV